MKQIIQNFKTGELKVSEVPVPSISKGFVLVENKYSLVSAGTERSTVKVGKASLIGKAKQRPDLVAQVLQNIKKEGVKATIQKVRTKLDSPKALGYSSAGVVLASMDTDGKFKPGDRVACAGQDYASHAEIVSVPQNLIVKIPDNVSFKEAAFTTLGAIALQGVRQASPDLGDNVAVIGLGLLGQITVQLLKANGCRVFGIDIAKPSIELALKSGADDATVRNDINLIKRAENFTGGHGFDKVIITAAAPTNDPVVLATELARKKGKIIVVGAVKMEIPREPHFYKKELELKISTSYGPGRYDPVYEEDGHDYPYPYVRWTEQRNMEAFLQLISMKKIDVKPLISHSFDIDEAEKAYDLVLGKTQEPYLGILIGYPERKDKKSSKINLSPTSAGELTIGMIGAGSFAQSYLLPNIKKANGFLHTVVTSKGITAKNVAEKFHFANASTNPDDVFENNDINTVFIATPHNTHAKYALQALLAGKHVFVEKPLALTQEDLEEIKNTYEKKPTVNLMVGFNRRFAPVVKEIKKSMENTGEPYVVHIRVNAGFILKDHWVQNPEIGGGRIIGEVCHFIDLMQFFTGSEPVKVYAESIDTGNHQMIPYDNIAVTVKFKDGSVGNLVYTANGDKSLPKEYIEIFSGNMVGRIMDFRSGMLHVNNKERKIKSDGKGHKEEVQEFLASVREGKPAPIDFHSLYLTSLATFKIIESLQTGLPQSL